MADVVIYDNVTSTKLYTIKRVQRMNFNSRKKIEQVEEPGQPYPKVEDNLMRDTILTFDGIIDGIDAGAAADGQGSLVNQFTAILSLFTNNGLLKATVTDGEASTMNFLGVLETINIELVAGQTKTWNVSFGIILAYSHEFNY